MNVVNKSYGPGITGAQIPVSLNFLSLSKITAALTIIGNAAFTVEVTLDNVFNESAADYVPVGAASWFTVAGAPTAADGYVTFDGPWQAIRLNISVNDTGVIFQVGQGESGRY